VSITALMEEVGFSLDAGALKKVSEVTPFFISHVFLKGLPTPQSGDAHRSPKFRLRRNRGEDEKTPGPACGRPGAR